MKRLNPNTGKPFVRGDARADGFLFWSYLRWCDMQGNNREKWLSPTSFNKSKAKQQSIQSNVSTEQRRQYQQNNRATVNAGCAKRRAAKLMRTPAWLSAEHLDQIKAVYKKANTLTQRTGVLHHVDHIVPLQGINVSGLHVPWNLQILTASENSSKSNRMQTI